MDLVMRAHMHYRLCDVEQLLARFMDDPNERERGYLYYTYEPRTSFVHLVPEDMAVAILINAFPNITALKRVFKTVLENATSLDLNSLPPKRLEDTTDSERAAVAELVACVAKWSNIKASIATKLLHKKRPELIPVMDNKAIFGAYNNPNWPDRAAKEDSVDAPARISSVLDWIYEDLTRPENANTWQHLAMLQPMRSRIELFDMVWWVHFKDIRDGQVGKQ